MYSTNHERVLDSLYENPVIAAIKGEQNLKDVINSDVKVVFILGGSLLTSYKTIRQLMDHHKHTFVHVDLIGGLGIDEDAIRFIAEKWRPTGIITTRKNLIKSAKYHNLLTIQRMFLLDSTSIDSGIALAKSSGADFVELMPGLIPKAIKRINKEIKQPIITGGMVTSQEEARLAIAAGAVGVSTSEKALWI